MAVGLSSCEWSTGDSEQRIQQGLDAVAAGNYGEAYWAWRPLADKGRPEAQYQLGWLYANGNGLRVDMAQAVDWWRKAAVRGHLDAEFAIGMAYLNGYGNSFPPDRPAALEWLGRAGGHGSEDAEDILIVLLKTDLQAVIQDSPYLLAESWLGVEMPPAKESTVCYARPSADSTQIGVFDMGVSPRRIDKSKSWVRVVSPDSSTLCWVKAKNFGDGSTRVDDEG